MSKFFNVVFVLIYLDGVSSRGKKALFWGKGALFGVVHTKQTVIRQGQMSMNKVYRSPLNAGVSNFDVVKNTISLSRLSSDPSNPFMVIIIVKMQSIERNTIRLCLYQTLLKNLFHKFGQWLMCNVQSMR